MFYGWVIVGITFVTQLVMIGTIIYAFGVLQKPMAAELAEGSRFGLSFAPVVMAVLGAALAPLIGRWVDRGAFRAVMLMGALFAAIGFGAMTQVGTLWQLQVVYALPLALAIALLGGIANPTLIANWFVTRRGTALGVSQFGMSFSGVVAAFVATALVESFGWRGAAAAFAMAPLLLVPLILWGIVDRPERRGLLPDGATASPEGVAAEPIVSRSDAAESWTLRRALREPSLWLIALAVGLPFAPNSAMVQLIHPYTTDAGYSPTQAASIFALMAWMGAVGKPLFGWLGDRLDLRLAVALCVGCQIGGMALILAAPSLWALSLATALFGIGYGGLLPLHGLLVGAFYGRWLFGRIMGLMQPMILPFQFLGLPLASWVFDQTGSYRGGMFAFLGMYVVAGGVLLALRPPAVSPDRAAQAA